LLLSLYSFFQKIVYCTLHDNLAEQHHPPLSSSTQESADINIGFSRIDQGTSASLPPPWRRPEL